LSTCLLEKNFLPSLFNCKRAASCEAVRPLPDSKQEPCVPAPFRHDMSMSLAHCK